MGRLIISQSSKQKKPCQPGILYWGKLSFKREGKMKTLPDKQKMTLLPLDLLCKTWPRELFLQDEMTVDSNFSAI